MKNKVILVILDGLNYETAIKRMGYMQHLVENNIADLYQVKAELPTLSRPLYEAILTGTAPYINGIVNNQVVRRSHERSIFHLAREKGLKTAAAAYYWISELYNKSPFDAISDREQADESQVIQYGKFYFEDTYPDSHLLIDGEILRRKVDPDFLLIHPMGIDDVGHRYGSETKEYHNKVTEVDTLLSKYIPLWIKEGYHIMITADHGMNAYANHGGIGADERIVPLWTIGACFKKMDVKEEIPQLMLAPIICRILNLAISDKMIDIDLTFCD